MEDLKENWNPNELVTFEPKSLEELNLDVQQVTFLSNIGLPQDAAPFLTFNTRLETLNENYFLQDSKYDSKIVLGNDGSGDPICIDLSDLNIYICDHEMEFENRYMNSTSIELFKFLSYYKNFLDKLREKNGAQENWDCNFTNEELNELIKDMKKIDSKALERDAFWQREIQTLKANREYYINVQH